MSDNKIDMYEGFWKYFGVFATIFIGIGLTWWGINIYFNYWFIARITFGPMGGIVLAPLIVGPTLWIFGVTEFLRILRE